MLVMPFPTNFVSDSIEAMRCSVCDETLEKLDLLKAALSTVLF
jgi:hypothetical protein